MLERALDAGVPGVWVTGDAVYGHHPALRGVVARRQPSVLAMPTNEPVALPGPADPQADTAAAVVARPPGRWRHLSAGDGSKVLQLYFGVRTCLLDHGCWC
jgi:hypothetical protein